MQAEEVAEERRECQQQRLEEENWRIGGLEENWRIGGLEERRMRIHSIDDSSIRIDSDSLLGSIGSDINLPTLSLHCHCQQLMRERGEGGGEGGEVSGEEFATISLSSTERLIEI